MRLATDELADGVTRVRLSGALGAAGADQSNLMLGVLAGSRQSLLIDMTELTSMTSMGVRSLLTVAKTLARRGGKLVLLQPNPQVAKILATTGAENLIPIRATLAEALAYLAG